jgi:hypothetical protein
VVELTLVVVCKVERVTLVTVLVPVVSTPVTDVEVAEDVAVTNTTVVVSWTEVVVIVTVVVNNISDVFTIAENAVLRRVVMLDVVLIEPGLDVVITTLLGVIVMVAVVVML